MQKYNKNKKTIKTIQKSTSNICQKDIKNISVSDIILLKNKLFHYIMSSYAYSFKYIIIGDTGIFIIYNLFNRCW